MITSAEFRAARTHVNRGLQESVLSECSTRFRWRDLGVQVGVHPEGLKERVLLFEQCCLH